MSTLHETLCLFSATDVEHKFETLKVGYDNITTEKQALEIELSGKKQYKDDKSEPHIICCDANACPLMNCGSVPSFRRNRSQLWFFSLMVPLPGDDQPCWNKEAFGAIQYQTCLSHRNG